MEQKEKQGKRIMQQKAMKQLRKISEMKKLQNKKKIILKKLGKQKENSPTKDELSSSFYSQSSHSFDSETLSEDENYKENIKIYSKLHKLRIQKKKINDSNSPNKKILQQININYNNVSEQNNNASDLNEKLNQPISQELQSHNSPPIKKKKSISSFHCYNSENQHSQVNSNLNSQFATPQFEFIKSQHQQSSQKMQNEEDQSAENNNSIFDGSQTRQQENQLYKNNIEDFKINLMNLSFVYLREICKNNSQIMENLEKLNINIESINKDSLLQKENKEYQQIYHVILQQILKFYSHIYKIEEVKEMTLQEISEIQTSDFSLILTQNQYTEIQQQNDKLLLCDEDDNISSYSFEYKKNPNQQQQNTKIFRI